MSADVLSLMNPKNNITENLRLLEAKFKWYAIYCNLVYNNEIYKIIIVG